MKIKNILQCLWVLLIVLPVTFYCWLLNKIGKDGDGELNKIINKLHGSYYGQKNT